MARKITTKKERSMRFLMVTLLLGLICLGICCPFTTLDSEGVQSEKNRLKMESKDDPCWFKSPEGFSRVDHRVIEERQEREEFGYPDRIPLSQAIEVLNKEQACIQNLEEGAKVLNEDEFLAALAAPPDYSTEARHKEWQPVLLEVLRTRTLPKGALLVGEGKGTFQSPIEEITGKEISLEGQRIYLFLGLDRQPRSNMTDNQVFLVKKALFGFTNNLNR
jgi:hypothetical protein